jgi:hypothetical protein
MQDEAVSSGVDATIQKRTPSLAVGNFCCGFPNSKLARLVARDEEANCRLPPRREKAGLATTACGGGKNKGGVTVT